MALPVILSVPHAGLRVPEEAAPYCRLGPRDIIKDGDEGADAIFALASRVAAHVTTDIARAIVDVNRSPDDRTADGVVKTHTCHGVPVYQPQPPEAVVRTLLSRYYHPYHERLRGFDESAARVGIDCHTMCAIGPPIGPDPGAERPAACLSNGEGTCPEAWLSALAECLSRALGEPVAINHPFRGGYIIREHAARLPWLQLEISRAPFLSLEEKREAIGDALEAWCRVIAASAG